MKPTHLKTPRTIDEGIWIPGGAAIEIPYKPKLGFWDYVLFGLSIVIGCAALWIFFWLVT